MSQRSGNKFPLLTPIVYVQKGLEGIRGHQLGRNIPDAQIEYVAKSIENDERQRQVDTIQRSRSR